MIVDLPSLDGGAHVINKTLIRQARPNPDLRLTLETRHPCSRCSFFLQQRHASPNRLPTRSPTDPGRSGQSQDSHPNLSRHFMQPSTSAVSPTLTTANEFETLCETNQHGFHLDPAGFALSSTARDGAETGSEQSCALDEPAATSSQESGSQQRQGQRGLSPSDRSLLPHARSRIDEYEQAATPPPRKTSGPVFDVIRAPRGPDDKRSPISELPNGWCNLPALS